MINGVENDVNNHVNVSVNVDANVHADSGVPSQSDVVHMEGLHIEHLDGSFLVMPDFGTQSIGGNGDNFHVDQVNNLVNNGEFSNIGTGLYAVSMSDGGGYGDPGCYTPELFGGSNHGGAGSSFSFAQNGTSTGGTSTDSGSMTGEHGSITGSASSAASVTQEAFTQHLVLGSNIQYNSSPISVVGGDSYADGSHDITHH